MPTNLVIEIFVDGLRSDGFFQAAAKSVLPLRQFLSQLDGTTVPEEYYVALGNSEGIPERFPVHQKITVYSLDQAKAIGHILRGWALLSVHKRVEVSSDFGNTVITHETLDIDAEMLRLV